MERSAPAAAIPQFALYGETAFTHTPEFVHLEDIHERSARNGWVIRPHRHAHLFQVLCMFSGEVEVRLDESLSKHRDCCLLTMPPGVVHGFRFRPDTRGVVLSLAINMLGLDAENQVAPLLDGALSRPQLVDMQPESLLYRQLSSYIELLRQELQVVREDQQLALFSLVRLILLTVRRRFQQEEPDQELQYNGIQLTQRFRQLLEQHYREHWPIAAYADRLHVSVSTLNRACRQVLGSTAKKQMQERLHVEARRRLIYTRETLDQISFDLGFRDAAYFSRVFKQLEGATPKAYRRSGGRA